MDKMNDDLPPFGTPRAHSEHDLRQRIAGFAHDPLGFVRFAFPWGEAGTPLARQRGPRPWQRSVLREIGVQLRRGSDGGPRAALRLAVAAGGGVGKSALLAWIKLWALATCDDATTLITANTGRQFDTGMWPQIAKWFEMMICRHWFRMNGEAIVSRDPDHRHSWRGAWITWKEDAPGIFGGLHNPGRRVALLFENAGAIPDAIWDAAEGALTDDDTEIIWIAVGTPTRDHGRFRECFGALRGLWSTWQIDSRAVSGTNKARIAQLIAERGEDSDFVRAHIKGMFPRFDTRQFIAPDMVEAARHRAATARERDRLVIGVDVARHGDGRTVLFFRRGLDARGIAPIRLDIPDLMQVASRIAETARRHRVETIFIDMGGMGAGVVDRLRQLAVPGVVGVEFAAAAEQNDPAARRGEAYANRRAELWGRLRDWLAEGAIPDIEELALDLVGPRYSFNARDQIVLERKEDMRRRGLASPDMADALALTFSGGGV